MFFPYRDVLKLKYANLADLQDTFCNTKTCLQARVVNVKKRVAWAFFNFQNRL